MDNRSMLILIVIISSSFLFFMIFVSLICICRRKGSTKDEESWDKDANFELKENGVEEMEMKGDLIKFQGGENLTCFDILNAPGEVIGKSSYGTLYRANLLRSDSVVLLRFLRPVCTKKVQDVMHVVQLLGSIRHPNLVPLCGFYAGPRGEKLLVHPFYRRGNLAQFIRDGKSECQKWAVIHRISTGIAKGLDYLHTGFQNPIIHGNLKSKNILLGRNQHPFMSDFGLHILLNQAAAQEMFEDAAVEGYKAPELIETKDMSGETDVYNFGVILLELLTGKQPIDEKASPNFTKLDHRISDVYRSDTLIAKNNADGSPVNEECILGFFQLAMACCSPSPSLRPDTKQICRKLEEI